jgi:hypothetical protein
MADIDRAKPTGQDQVSMFRPYSTGVVVDHQVPGKHHIKVHLLEVSSALTGNLQGQEDVITAEGVDPDGGEYSDQITARNYVVAKWLKLGAGNRITPPNVRRGDKVMVYRKADTEDYYWIDNDDPEKNFRRLETAIFAFNADPEEGNYEPTPDNSYFFEVSTHRGKITLSTSQRNGEFCKYNFQFNTKDGRVVLADNVDNVAVFNSAENQLYYRNADGSVLDITREKFRLFTKDSVEIETKNFKLTAEEGVFDVDQMTVNNDSYTQKTSSWDLNSDSVNVEASSIDMRAPTIHFPS